MVIRLGQLIDWDVYQKKAIHEQSITKYYIHKLELFSLKNYFCSFPKNNNSNT